MTLRCLDSRFKISCSNKLAIQWCGEQIWAKEFHAIKYTITHWNLRVSSYLLRKRGRSYLINKIYFLKIAPKIEFIFTHPKRKLCVVWAGTCHESSACSPTTGVARFRKK